jgi:hypothetical protein
MNAFAYLDLIKLKLVSSLAVRSIIVVQERALPEQGFFRARLTLANGDFAEVSEYFVSEEGRIRTVEYRHQWMDVARQELRKRWNNAEHHPDLPSFPDHVHVGGERCVEPGRPLSIVEWVDIVERELALQP